MLRPRSQLRMLRKQPQSKESMHTGSGNYPACITLLATPNVTERNGFLSR